jgi:ribosomal protein S18 acetylase RimI-like enzyme
MLLKIIDIENLLNYLNGLSAESKKRFEPHPFDRESVLQLMNNNLTYFMYSAKETSNQQIVAYAIIKRGWLDFEHQRLKSYGLSPTESDFTIAPSVADLWQSKGLGNSFMQYIITQMEKVHGAQRIILWGGVQSDNIKAVRLYQKSGFRTLGFFEYNGKNQDMILEL